MIDQRKILADVMKALAANMRQEAQSCDDYQSLLRQQEEFWSSRCQSLYDRTGLLFSLATVLERTVEDLSNA